MANNFEKNKYKNKKKNPKKQKLAVSDTKYSFATNAFVFHVFFFFHSEICRDILHQCMYTPL